MPSFKIHCEATVKALGEPFEEVHKWLDEFADEAPLSHRYLRHNIGGVNRIIVMYGWKAGAAACLHISMDEEFIKVDGLWVRKEDHERTAYVDSV